jgi:NAD(P)-dependent dehydrogenase (short-subunit alcohol dehydrogenase family)
MAMIGRIVFPSKEGTGMRLRDKVAIVAGAGWGGIGAATAYLFAQEGARLIVDDLPAPHPERLEETVARIRAIGGEVETVRGDVADRATWEEIVRVARERFGRLDILVHNASAFVGGRPLDITEEQFHHALDVTVGGPLNGARACIPEMIAGGGGSLIFISSVNGTITNPMFSMYSVAKAGLNALARSIAFEYGREGIRCNAIAPGQIVGEREAVAMAADPLEHGLSQDCYPLGRYGRPEDIAKCALFLASEDAAFVTGTVLAADGGLTIQSPEALVRPSFRARWRDDILVPVPKEQVDSPYLRTLIQMWQEEDIDFE